MEQKWITKYLKLAKVLAEDNDACYSRQIAVVLVSPQNRIIGMGYNGAAEHIPHADSTTYLVHLYSSLLTEDDKNNLHKQGMPDAISLCNKYAGCKICPRKILGIPSGARLELCPCVHAERNCLASANVQGVSTLGSTMFCYCGVPCFECTNQIIQAGIKTIVCLQTEDDYSKSSRWLFEKANRNIIEVDKETFAKSSSMPLLDRDWLK